VGQPVLFSLKRYCISEHSVHHLDKCWPRHEMTGLLAREGKGTSSMFSVELGDSVGIDELLWEANAQRTARSVTPSAGYDG
jgi:hypothetical protein